MKSTAKRIIITILCLLVLSMSLPPVLVMGAQSPITGGDFENTVIKSNSSATTGWRYNNSTKAVISTDHAYTDQKSVKLTTTSTSYGTFSYTPITVSANSNYTFSFAIFVETAGAADFRYSLMSGTKYLENAKNITVAGTVGQWYYYEITVNSGDYTELTLRLQPYSGGVYYIDEVNLRGDIVDVNVTYTEGGYITGYNANNEYFISDTLDLYAHPFADYAFSGWYQDDTLVSNDRNLNLNITQSVSLTARFEYSKFIDNRIVGGEFEDDIDLDFSGNALETFSRASDPYSGEWALKMTDSGYIEQIFTVTPNTDYVLSFRTKLGSASAVAQYTVYNGDNTVLKGADISAANGVDTVWGASRMYFNSGKNTKMRLRFAAVTGTVFVDSAVISTPVSITVTAGQNGSVTADGTSPYAKGETVVFTAVPEMGYRVDYWAQGDTSVAVEKTLTVTASADTTFTVRFVEAIYPLLTDFDVGKTVCAPQNNLVSASNIETSTGAVWNAETFIKDGVMSVTTDPENSENTCLLFSPNSTTAQISYFAVSLSPYTDYMLSMRVRGSYFDSVANLMDATFGVINPENGEFLVLSNPKNGGYYDESLNCTSTRSLTPPAWDAQWHSRGCAFNSGDNSEFYIAVIGSCSEMYIDDITLCLAENAVYEKSSITGANITDTMPKKTVCDGEENLAAVCETYGGNMFTDVYTTEYYGKNALVMRQATPVPTAAAYIQWMEVKPDTHYTLSFSVMAGDTAIASYGLVQDYGGYAKKIWNQSVYISGQWRQSAVSFSSGDITRIGVFVRDVAGSIAISDLCLFESEVYTPETEVLRGGDFENCNIDAFVLSKDPVDFEITDGVSYSGKYSLKIGTQSRWQNIRQIIGVKPNTDYRIIFYGMREEENSTIWKILDAETLKPLEGLVENYYVNGDGKWLKNGFTFNSGNHDSLAFIIVSDLGTTYIDDIRFLIPTYTGDTSRDGNTDSDDIRILKQALLGVSEKRYDINKDDIDDIRDLVRLKKILSGISY